MCVIYKGTALKALGDNWLLEAVTIVVAMYGSVETCPARAVRPRQNVSSSRKPKPPYMMKQQPICLCLQCALCYYPR